MAAYSLNMLAGQWLLKLA